MQEILFLKRPLKGLFLYLVFLSFTLSSQKYYPEIVRIEFEGNTKTLDYIIDREIQYQINTNLDSLKADQDRNRLENLGLFSQVEWIVIPLEDGTAILKFIIIESIQKTPPFALPTYEEDSGWSLTGFYLINNLKGKNQSLVLGGSIGGKDTYGVQFSDPWVFGNHISMNFQIGKTLYKHRFLEKKLEVNSFNLNFGKWFGEKLKTQLGIEIEEKIFLDKSLKRSFLYYSPMLSINYDTRDVYWNPGRGVILSQYITRNKGINPKSFILTRWDQSYSTFYSKDLLDKKTVFAFNISSKTKSGKKEELWLDYFGGQETVRGWDLPDSSLYYSNLEEFRFGHESIQSSIEIRREIIPKYATSLKIEFGLVLVLFTDIGFIARDFDEINYEKPISGTGLGIRIPFPIVNVLRLDFGWGHYNNKWNNGSFHFGIGQKF